MEYNFRQTEPKWSAYWKKNGIYKVGIDREKPKYYILDMFPYPSGAGLHVGHPLGYIATDIYSRYKRMKGFNVLHPMGFDAFGLPAEQYAIETGQHPAVTTEQNIKRYKEQLEKIGFSYDWDREVRTSDPDYYKWTQWIFTQLFHHWFDRDTQKAQPIEGLIHRFGLSGNTAVKAVNSHTGNFTAADWESFSPQEKEQVLEGYRLAYLAYAEVNWCPALGTVLANDEVKDGVSERGGYPVFKKKMRQWFLRITAYAETLLSGLNQLDWPDSLKEMQRNWIGRSEGATIFFELDGHDEKLEIFTTRPDTVFGATFMILAPEHEMTEILTVPGQKEDVDNYLKYIGSRTDIERQQEKKVTGVFTGSYALHPYTGKKTPVWIAEYVLAGYGTGSIMAVPSDDERDYVFAQKFNLDIIEVIDRSDYPDAKREDKQGKMIHSGPMNGMEVKDAISFILNDLESTGKGSAKINYKLRDAGFSRQRYWGEPFPIVYHDGVPETLPEDGLPLTLPEIESYKPTEDGEAPLARNKAWTDLGNGSYRETDTMPGYAGSSWYFLRYMDPKNPDAIASEEAIDYWQDVDFYIGGSEHAVGHLMYARFWHRFLHDLDIVPTSEPFKKLVNQGMIQGRSNIVYRINNENRFVSAGLKENYSYTELRVDVNMVSNDILDTEAFTNWREEYRDAEFLLENGKYHCGYEIEKMSKRWHNVVNPDDVIHEYSADAFRMYEMFLGPLEIHKPWDTNGIDGVAKFLKKYWRLFYENGNWLINTEDPTGEELKILHLAIKKVIDDIERLSFNTAVSAFMVAVNGLSGLKCHKQAILEPLNLLLSPFAPFITEEIHAAFGNQGSVHHEKYPVLDESYLKEESFNYPVSVNGKMRTKIEFPLDMEIPDIEKVVLANDVVQKWLEGQPPKKVIVVKGRIINIVK